MSNPYYFPTDHNQLMHGDAHIPGAQSTVDEVMYVLAHGGEDKDGTTQEQWLESLREFGVLDRIAIIIAKEYYNDAFSRFHKMMEDDIKAALGD
jgi:uncharacterized protein (DUF433 family)